MQSIPIDDAYRRSEAGGSLDEMTMALGGLRELILEGIAAAFITIFPSDAWDDFASWSGRADYSNFDLKGLGKLCTSALSSPNLLSGNLASIHIANEAIQALLATKKHADWLVYYLAEYHKVDTGAKWVASPITDRSHSLGTEAAAPPSAGDGLSPTGKAMVGLKLAYRLLHPTNQPSFIEWLTEAHRSEDVPAALFKMVATADGRFAEMERSSWPHEFSALLKAAYDATEMGFIFSRELEDETLAQSWADEEGRTATLLARWDTLIRDGGETPVTQV